jgi:hypothetical protein
MITYTVTVEDNGTTHWYNANNEFHRIDGPAIEYANGTKSWWKNNKLHRLDGPAVEYSDGYKEWYIEDIKYTEEEFQAKIKPMNRPCVGKKIVVEYSYLY